MYSQNNMLKFYHHTGLLISSPSAYKISFSPLSIVYLVNDTTE